ncbi:hypothetical protein [Sediminivirga luteola]|uniref:Uncharacterized protein n=1 Tax=Sediminivirga luteola TaxID=1774748 RepID=A0A8J2TTT8_9MICO|nr:hypothetical protein [Sediminivirga luteola]MCI2264758.1 hypothetical protein [Sediminivirga luteola]GGA01940.1 hypothetical protein GCM10011333_00570 [Sediminivirga luteola]
MPKSVYIRRRIIVGALALLVLAGLVTGGVFAVRGVIGLIQGTGAEPVAEADAAGEAQAGEQSAEATPEPSPEPGEDEGEAGDGEAAEPTETCAEDSVQVTARTDKGEYAEGENPALELVVATDAEQACLIDVGTAQQEFIVNRDGEQVWSSADCYDVDADRDTARVMEPFEPEQERRAVMEWPRIPSEQGCPAVDEEAGPGEYELVVVLGRTESEPVSFTLE